MMIRYGAVPRTHYDRGVTTLSFVSDNFVELTHTLFDQKLVDFDGLPEPPGADARRSDQLLAWRNVADQYEPTLSHPVSQYVPGLPTHSFVLLVDPYSNPPEHD